MKNRIAKTFHPSYAFFYDLLCSHKNYEKEAKALYKMFKASNAEKSAKVLDLGCGTGRHARFLASWGIKVMGIDSSQAMIDEARKKNSGVFYKKVSLENYKGRKISFIYSMGHVVNYLEDMTALKKLFKNVYQRLNKSGVFYFEFWNLDSLLLKPPRSLTRHYRLGSLKVLRPLTPELDLDKQRMRFRYKIELRKGNKKIKTFSSDHDLKIFSNHEIEACLKKTGFTHIRLLPAFCEKKILKKSTRFLGFYCVK